MLLLLAALHPDMTLSRTPHEDDDYEGCQLCDGEVGTRWVYGAHDASILPIHVKYVSAKHFAKIANMELHPKPALKRMTTPNTAHPAAKWTF